MPETVTQINTMNDGITIVGEFPDKAIQTSVELQVGKRQSAKENFQKVVDETNLNDKYSDVLMLAGGYFTDRELETAPLRVIDRDTLHRAYDVAGTSMKDEIGEEEGRYVNGRALVVENQEMIEMFGEDEILGIALHEAAHSLGSGEHFVRTVKENGRNVALGGLAIGIGSLSKVDLRKDSDSTIVGDFWEEAFADLTRVRALRELGRTHDIEGNTSQFEEGGVSMVAVPNGSSVKETGVISFPAEFALQAKSTSGKNYVAHSASNYAAFALELLDKSAPGLYDDFLAARQDPVRQREAIQKIENIQPGLYKQLRDLVLDNRDFAGGLKLVVDVLGGESVNQDDRLTQLKTA